MKYIFSRGNSPAQSFSEIPLGGLYLPESYPQVGVTISHHYSERGSQYNQLFRDGGTRHGK